MERVIILSAVLIGCVTAFGAGNVPSYGALEGLKYRHGDIEDILLTLIMYPTSGAAGFLSKLNPLKNHKFNAMAVKRVYFGNFLRDYSQAIDVGTLSKGLDAKTIRLLVWVMSFMAFGYATEEFEVTDERLGCYRCEEHIDNPKGYPSPEEPDARKFDPRLRGPVEQIELEVDPRTGLKNYIANESGHWVTSSAYVRNSLLRCIELGREAKHGNGGDAAEFESLRLLGQAMHTLEDYSAHSNFVELCLIELGYRDVFPHVGTSTGIQLNGKSTWPIVTGTFGGLDFVHSLLGEASDKISQTQITELQTGLGNASTQGSSGLLSDISGLVNSIPGAGSLVGDISQMQGISQESDNLRKSSGTRDRGTAGQMYAEANTDADEIFRKIYPVMAFRDRLMKGLSAFFEKIPGLNALIDKISESLTVWVLSTIQPFISPLVTKVTGGLAEGSALVTAKDDQLAVFNDPHCSDPTHSMLAKDHFSCYLNGPAGKVAQAVVKHCVERVTRAWVDTQVDPRQLIDEILETFHHPAQPQGRSGIQQEMSRVVQEWVESLGSKKQTILSGLTMQGVRNGLHHEGGSAATTGVESTHSHAAHGSGGGGGSHYGQAAAGAAGFGAGAAAAGHGQSGSYGQSHSSSHGQGGAYGQSQSSSYGQSPSGQQGYQGNASHSSHSSTGYNKPSGQQSHSQSQQYGGGHGQQGNSHQQSGGHKPSNTQHFSPASHSQQYSSNNDDAPAYGSDSYSGNAGHSQSTYGGSAHQQSHQQSGSYGASAQQGAYGAPAQQSYGADYGSPGQGGFGGHGPGQGQGTYGAGYGQPPSSQYGNQPAYGAPQGSYGQSYGNAAPSPQNYGQGYSAPPQQSYGGQGGPSSSGHQTYGDSSDWAKPRPPQGNYGSGYGN
ncbi:heterokaryon incompatibility protein Het-C-domain-containing protein [Protomyces lactucae-debilis]|uniref:Heterokaryon incompatibility protein Het-C-domain-containing protein n=1 Tax=Protomyces lactucae-debilis TaxID=2754530 RepID=A0A1Y2EZ59_PROLT|nr:heterokaryon incompatibility protein Het-C-domain-containing protein [Protomyces lactucae-debilis]ORY76025.1 heterokaryon incompatibility protein Het-C-domain-containing protein [Protomyces lactucae-debilis]